MRSLIRVASLPGTAKVHSPNTCPFGAASLSITGNENAKGKVDCWNIPAKNQLPLLADVTAVYEDIGDTWYIRSQPCPEAPPKRGRHVNVKSKVRMDQCYFPSK